MTAYRWERERSAYRLAHSKPGGTLRRRSEILGRDVRRGTRAGAGLETVAAADEVTPDLWSRLTRNPATGERGRRVRYGIAAVVAVVVAGPGIALGLAGYRGLLWASPRIGRLWWWPWAVASATSLAALVLADVPFGLRLHLDRYFPLTLLDFGPWWGWLVWQVAASLGVVAFEIWAWGWRGVPKRAVAKSDRNADGNFREIGDGEKFKLDAGGDTDYVPPVIPDDEDDAADALNDDIGGGGDDRDGGVDDGDWDDSERI